MRGILMYHSVDSSGSAISVSDEQFSRHVRFLASGRVRVVPLADLPSVPDDEDAVALTFDDGFRNFASTAAPMLADAGLPATVFVVSGAAGRDNAWGGAAAPEIPVLPLMSWDEIASVATAGFEIGAHTRTHADLTRLPAAKAEEEMAGGADDIAARLGRRPLRFAYPYGATSPAVAAVARRTFAMSCTTALRPLRDDDDSALIPRLDAWYFRGAGRLEAWGTPAFRRRIWLRAQGRRVRRLMAGTRP